MMLMLMALISSFAYAQSSITICDGTDENTAIPFYFYYLDTNNTTSQMIYPASELQSLVGKKITGLSFFSVGYQKAWAANMVVSIAEVDYETISSDNADYIQANFTEVFNGEVSGAVGGTDFAFTFDAPYVYAGKNLLIQIKNTTSSSYQSVAFYGKSLLGEFNATYGYSGSFKYNVGFTPKVNIAYSEAQLEEFAAAVSTNSLKFGTVFTGETAVKEFTITNNGSAELTAEISGVDAPYSIETASYTIPSLSSVTVPVTFAPAEDGSHNQTLSINLGQAGTFEVALEGTSTSAPTGYQQAFEVGNKTLPIGWTGWSVKSTYDSSAGDYVFESEGASLDYFVGTTIDGTKAVAIKDSSNPVREYPSQYAVYMISPVMEGRVMITARSTTSSAYITPELKVYKATKNDNGTYTIGEEITLSWTAELNNTFWSHAFLTLSEKTPIAVFMKNYCAVSTVAADSAEGVTGGGDNGDDDDDENQTFDPITICDGSETSNYLPFYFYYLDNATTKAQVIYPASKLTEFVGKQITGLKFYHEGYPSAWSGNMAVSLAEVDYSVWPEGNSDYIDADFKEVWAGPMSGDETMNTFEFTFDTPFVYNGQNLVVEIRNTTAGSSWPQVYFYGESLLGDVNGMYGWSSTRHQVGFLPKVTISYGEMAEFAAAVSAESINYSTIFTGETVTKNITVNNNGSADLTASISGVSAPYSVEAASYSIPSLSSVTIPVTFAPTADGSYNQTMTIDLGEAGSFDVALSGNSMTAPTGYQQAFEIEDKSLPEHWNGWTVKSVYDYSLWEYVYDSSEYSLEYFVGTEIEGTKAISIKEGSNPFKQTPNQWEIYMISPEVSGNVMITARGTNTSTYITPELKVFNVTLAEDGTCVIGDEIEVNWTSELNNTQWSNAIFTLAENTRVALFMSYSAVSTFAADHIEIKTPQIGDEFTNNGLTYVVKTETEVGVIGVSNDVTECVVPASVNYLGSPFSVVSIEKDAFYWSNVTSVELPATVTTIAYGAFRSTPLASVNIPESVTSIGAYAFYNTDITAISIPEGVTAIEASTFSQCDQLTSVELPSTLQKIGQGAFYKSAITAVNLPQSCLTIAMYAFESCSQLASVTLPEGLTELAMGLFQDCTSLTAITIPESVVTIHEAAFQSTGITALHFPKNVTTIKSNAFNDTPVSTITVDADNTSYTVIDGALYSADKRFICLYPRSTESKAYDIVDGCIAVLGGAFYGCDIKTVTFPEGFIGIDSYGFCKSDLESVQLPATLTELWEQAFAGTKLTSVVVPESITKINEAVFADCANLTKVTLPTSLTDVGNRAFFRCKALTTINCLGEVPAEFDAWETATDPFYEVDCTKVTLNVPIATLADYQASEWADFFTIINGVDFAGIDSIIADGLEISIVNGVITINADNANVTITAINGTVVCNQTITGGQFTAELPKGVYIITIAADGKVYNQKVAL